MAGEPLIVRLIYCFTPGPATPRRPPQPPFSDILFHPRFLFNFSKISISSSNDALCEVCWHSFNHLKLPLHWSTFVTLSAHQSFVVSVLFHCWPSFVVPLFLFASPTSILSFMTDILFVHPLLFSFLSPFLIDVRLLFNLSFFPLICRSLRA